MPNYAKTQAPLNGHLVRNIDEKAEHRWTPGAKSVFQKAKDELAQAALLDASDFNPEIVL